MTKLYYKDSGHSINLVKQLNTSGEGIIYSTDKSGFLAKVYHNPTPERIEKLQVMINNQPSDPTLSQGHTSIAWPKAVLKDQAGQSLGFLMPEIKNGQTLINVYSPKLRAKQAPGFSWVYLHVTAMNIAYIVHALHVKNYVIGDLKQQNLLVNPNGLVSIIDTDSLQVRDPKTGKIYRSHVGSAEYTPPEMFNVDFSQVDRSELHDRFALAIIIWQLLFGSHPFTGQWIGSANQPNIDKLIHQGDWMYGKSTKLRPTRLSIPFNIIHPKLQDLFPRCFDDGCHRPYARPSAFQWQEALKIAISNLNLCTQNSIHYYEKNYGKCYWCERNQNLGHEVFFSPQTTSVITSQPPRPSQPPIVVPPSPPPVKYPKFKPVPFLFGLAIGAFALVTSSYWLLILAGLFIIGSYNG